MKRPAFRLLRSRGFTLLEVALIVAIIGMMMLMIVGYLLAPKQTGPLPPVEAAKLIPGSSTLQPAATPAPSATPIQTIEPTPKPAPSFR